MARYRGPVCRMCRREGEKLFLKGERCYSNKCAVERREGGPGVHGRGRQSRSDYKTQLREKQKVKRMYGLLEKQFRQYFEIAASTKGVTGTLLLQNLETRLDNVAYRLGFGISRSQARQRVLHGAILVNGKSVNVPSFRVSVGDIVEVRENMKKAAEVVTAMDSATSRIIPEWLVLEKGAARGTVSQLPTREMMAQSINEQLIVELYSK